MEHGSSFTRFTTAGRVKCSRRRSGLAQLFSFQPLAVWGKLQSDKILFVDSQRIHEINRFGSNWMRKQMLERVPGHEGHFPWWAYFGKKPDLRSWSYAFPDQDGVCFELQIDQNRVILSDYETWHCVGSRHYIPFNKQECDACELELWGQGYQGEWPPPVPWRRRVVNSWDRVFDLHALRAAGLWRVNTIQACFERLELADVVAVTHLKVRV